MIENKTTINRKLRQHHLWKLTRLVFINILLKKRNIIYLVGLTFLFIFGALPYFLFLWFGSIPFFIPFIIFLGIVFAGRGEEQVEYIFDEDVIHVRKKDAEVRDVAYDRILSILETKSIYVINLPDSDDSLIISKGTFVENGEEQFRENILFIKFKSIRRKIFLPLDGKESSDN